MNLETFPSESQVISTMVPIAIGRLVSRWIGMMGKKLAERPVIEQRLEDGKIADVLVGRA